MKPVILKASVSDKLYINKKDVLNLPEFEGRFIYQWGDDFLSSLEYQDDICILPSNAIHKLDIKELDDSRNRAITNETLEFLGTLRPEQDDAAVRFFPHGYEGRGFNSGILQARCGWGKTYALAKVIAKAQYRTIILVHSTLLFYQWIAELQNLIKGVEIGMIGDQKQKLTPITVAIYKSVYNRINELRNSYALGVVDEAHLCPAEMFSETLMNLNLGYKVGTTATPSRKDGRHLIFPDVFGPMLIKARDENKIDEVLVEIIESGVSFNIRNPQLEWSRELTKLGLNEQYLKLIVAKAKEDIKAGRAILIINERVAALQALKNLIPDSKLLIGATKKDEREYILANMGKTIPVMLTTKLLDEGISCHRLDTLYLTSPNNNYGRLEQRIGRIIRLHEEKLTPKIVDFWLRGMIVARQQITRKRWYEQQGFTIL